VDRVAWDDLPAEVTDTVFAKGMPCSARRVITQAREAAVAPLVQHISPALLWHLEDTAGWDVLGYQYTEGRHANYQPGSTDLDMIAWHAGSSGSWHPAATPPAQPSNWQHEASGGMSGTAW
jgi:hypothetical protein